MTAVNGLPDLKPEKEKKVELEASAAEINAAEVTDLDDSGSEIMHSWLESKAKKRKGDQWEISDFANVDDHDDSGSQCAHSDLDDDIRNEGFLDSAADFNRYTSSDPSSALNKEAQRNGTCLNTTQRLVGVRSTR